MGQNARERLGKQWENPVCGWSRQPSPDAPPVPPKRRRNRDVRVREYLTQAEVERLIEAAGRNFYAHRDRHDDPGRLPSRTRAQRSSSACDGLRSTSPVPSFTWRGPRTVLPACIH